MIILNRQLKELQESGKKEIFLDEHSFPALFAGGKQVREIAIWQEGEDIIVQTTLGDRERIMRDVRNFIDKRSEQLNAAILAGQQAVKQLAALQDMR